MVVKRYIRKNSVRSIIKMLEAGTIINQRYQLQTKLGRNVGRQTWLAKDLQLESNETATDSPQTDLVVVKLLAFGGDVQWEDLKLFEREAQILQQLNHDRIPKYQDYFAIDDRNLWFGLVQEYIPGNSLRELLDKGKRFSELEIKKIAQEILNILLYLHDSKPPLLHRDIKPSNLILGTDNKIYLVDFGAVQDRAATEGATFTVVGTYGYAPIEQFGGKAIPASDLYALGATLIHLLTRTTPADLPFKDLKIQFRERIFVKPQLATWLEKITAPAIERRFKTAQQALKALESVDRKSDFTPLIVSKLHHNLPLSHNIQVIREKEYLDIKVFKKGIQNLQDIGHLSGVFLVFLFSISIAIATYPLGLIVLIICYLACYPYLEYLFSDTQVKFTHQRFVIIRKLFFNTIQEQGQTPNIQDISVNYQAINEQTNLKLSNANAIIINTKKSNSYRVYRQYSFGKRLNEEESIWIANEIRHWLNEYQSSKH